MYDLVTYFGDLGGLFQFLNYFIIFFISRYQEKMTGLVQVQNNFRVLNPNRKALNLAQQNATNGGVPSLSFRNQLFKKLQIRPLLSLKLVYWPCCGCCSTRKERLLHDIIQKGSDKLDKALDIRSILNLQRVFSTLLRLEYSSTTRKLMYL